MGRRNYLIEGVSGTGKTAVCTELQRRGYQVIHGDLELVYQGDPETGLPLIRDKIEFSIITPREGEDRLTFMGSRRGAQAVPGLLRSVAS